MVCRFLEGVKSQRESFSGGEKFHIALIKDGYVLSGKRKKRDHSTVERNINYNVVKYSNLSCILMRFMQTKRTLDKSTSMCIVLLVLTGQWLEGTFCYYSNAKSTSRKTQSYAQDFLISIFSCLQA